MSAGLLFINENSIKGADQIVIEPTNVHMRVAGGSGGGHWHTGTRMNIRWDPVRYPLTFSVHAYLQGGAITNA